MSNASVVGIPGAGGGGTEPIVGQYNSNDSVSARTVAIPESARCVIIDCGVCSNSNLTAATFCVAWRGQTSCLMAENLNGTIRIRTVTVKWTDTTVVLPALSYIQHNYYDNPIYCRYTIL